MNECVGTCRLPFVDFMMCLGRVVDALSLLMHTHTELIAGTRVVDFSFPHISQPCAQLPSSRLSLVAARRANIKEVQSGLGHDPLSDACCNPWAAPCSCADVAENRANPICKVMIVLHHIMQNNVTAEGKKGEDL